MSDIASVMPVLETLRDCLAAVPGVNTCRVGLEASITPTDYPIVRIDPTRINDSKVIGRRRVAVNVVFGVAVHEFEGGFEALLLALLEMETSIITAATSCPGIWCEYLDTLFDEEPGAAFKVAAVRLVVEG